MVFLPIFRCLSDSPALSGVISDLIFIGLCPAFSNCFCPNLSGAMEYQSCRNNLLKYRPLTGGYFLLWSVILASNICTPDMLTSDCPAYFSLIFVRPTSGVFIGLSGASAGSCENLQNNCEIPQLRYIPYLQDIPIPQLRDNLLLEQQSPVLNNYLLNTKLQETWHFSPIRDILN